MSTPCTIVAFIPKEARGKTYQFPKGNLEFDTPSVTIPEDAEYVEVYRNFDGYPEGTGSELVDRGYDSFDDVMTNIISGGDMRYFGTPYHAWRNEDWDDVKPRFTKEMPSISEFYQYYFDENLRWWYRGDKGEFNALD